MINMHYLWNKWKTTFFAKVQSKVQHLSYRHTNSKHCTREQDGTIFMFSPILCSFSYYTLLPLTPDSFFLIHTFPVLPSLSLLYIIHPFCVHLFLPTSCNPRPPFNSPRILSLRSTTFSSLSCTRTPVDLLVSEVSRALVISSRRQSMPPSRWRWVSLSPFSSRHGQSSGGRGRAPNTNERARQCPSADCGCCVGNGARVASAE